MAIQTPIEALQELQLRLTYLAKDKAWQDPAMQDVYLESLRLVFRMVQGLRNEIDQGVSPNEGFKRVKSFYRMPYRE